MKAKENAQLAFSTAHDFFLAKIFAYGRKPSAFQIYDAWENAEREIVSGLYGDAFDDPGHPVNSTWDGAVDAEMIRLYSNQLLEYRTKWENED